MRRNIIIIIMALSVLSQSCIYTKMTRISDDDSRWTEVMNVQDTVFYSSNRGNTDTLVVEKINNTNTRNPFYFWSTSCLAYSARSSALCIIKQSDCCPDVSGKKFIEFSVVVYRSAENDSLFFSTIFYNFSSRSDRSQWGLNFDKCKKKRVKCGDTVYDECVIVDSTIARYPEAYKNQKRKTDKYIIAKDHGLIYYRFDDGEEFVRRR